MEKVFLVEDEIVVREGIKRNIDWEANGYELCGDARDGELAYPLIQKMKPDIVITDIKMPFMDGLELSRLIKKEQPETEIILLTGYEDFTYAKEGIEIGVVKYLTKPISSEELLNELNEVAEKIRERKKATEIKEQTTIENQFNVDNLDVENVDKAKIIEFLKFGKRENMESFVDEFVGNAGSNFLKSLIFRQYIVMDTYLTVVGFVESLGHNRNEIDSLEKNTEVLNSSGQSRAFIYNIINQALAIREENATNKYKQTIDTVIDYIKENYADEELSLNELANIVNVSPNHLSMIFSQQTGVPFIKYLTDLRLNKARELLKCTTMRSSEIGEAVGYHDPHYFSYLFKKSFGVTPTQYREDNE